MTSPRLRMMIVGRRKSADKTAWPCFHAISVNISAPPAPISIKNCPVGISSAIYLISMSSTANPAIDRTIRAMARRFSMNILRINEGLDFYCRVPTSMRKWNVVSLMAAPPREQVYFLSGTPYSSNLWPLRRYPKRWAICSCKASISGSTNSITAPEFRSIR